MATRETVRPITDRQKSDIIATIVGVIPRLTFDEAQGIIGNKGPFLADIRSAFEHAKQRIASTITTYPADGEVFELTLNGDLPENQPLEMVRRGGYVGEWTHKGPVVKGKHARRFKLVSVGYCASFEEVKRKLKPHGKIPEGQWREAFRTVYPKSDGKGPIGVADSSWARPGGDALFPCVGIYGDSRFDWAVIVFSGDWRWLVEVESE